MHGAVLVVRIDRDWRKTRGTCQSERRLNRHDTRDRQWNPQRRIPTEIRDGIDDRLLDGEGIRRTNQRAATTPRIPRDAKPRLEVVVLTIHLVLVHTDAQQRRSARV